MWNDELTAMWDERKIISCQNATRGRQEKGDNFIGNSMMYSSVLMQLVMMILHELR